MAALEQTTGNPCDLCQNWRPVNEVWLKLTAYIPDIIGHMCALGICDDRTRGMCGWSDTTSFIPSEGVSEEQIRNKLQRYALNAVIEGRSKNHQKRYPSSVEFK